MPVCCRPFISFTGALSDMAQEHFVVVRLVPESPVDGTTFSTYLADLQLEVKDANASGKPGDPAHGLLSDPAHPARFSPLALFQWPPGSGSYLEVTSARTSEPTTYVSKADYGNELTFPSTEGISAGSFAISADHAAIPADVTINNSPIGLHVVEVTATKVTLNEKLPNYVPRGTPISFIGKPPSDGDITTVPGFAVFTCKPSGTAANDLSTLIFPAGDADGIPVGATLDPVVNLVDANTTVTGATSGDNHADATITLSKALLGQLGAGDELTFKFPLSSGIVQHTETIQVGWDFFDGSRYAVIPAAAATAVIPLTQPTPLPNYLDIKISAGRVQVLPNGQHTVRPIPDASTYHNVKKTHAELPAVELYQAIPAADTSLYLSIPPPPDDSTVLLSTPGDGSAPDFGILLGAIKTALGHDPIDGTTLATLVNSSASCRRIAYDIVWSYQNDLPPLPDPLESLYTNPPNTGGGGKSIDTTNSSGSTNGSNNYEMDRQKFEGALKSFYSMRNATAERLTKFVAAASAAVACQQLSRSATTALLEFPVDPSASLTAAVESEILLAGLGTGGPGGLDFGVPAAFFYILGASLDKSTTATQRYQMACGDSVDRLLRQFEAAADAGLLEEPQPFWSDGSDGLDQLNGLTPFQAARRLAALGVSTASGSPSVTVIAGRPLASLVVGWAAATDPAGAQSPPPSYQQNDFTIWSQQLAALSPRGYLDLDLDALTRGFVIPPFTASPSADVNSGSVLTFAAGSGIGAGMPVSGPGIAPGTTVSAVTSSGSTTTVTLSAPVTGPVTTTAMLVFNYSIAPVTRSSTGLCPKGSAALTFSHTAGISAGMTVLGAGIAANATVLSVTATTVTLSAGVTADVGAGSQIAFVIAPGSALPALTITTAADCASGANLLTVGAATGISAGMTAVADGLPPGTTVLAVTASTVALSATATAVIHSGSPVTFTLAAGGPLPTLAATTTTDRHTGVTLIFGGSGGTGSISVGMSVSGPGIAAGCTVADVSASTVTLSAGVTAEVLAGSLITFAFLPSTLADQIALWLPGTTVPSTAEPTCRDAEAGHGGSVGGLLRAARHSAVAAAVHPAGRSRHLVRAGLPEGRLRGHADPRVRPGGPAVLHRLNRRHGRPAAARRRARDLRCSGR